MPITTIRVTNLFERHYRELAARDKEDAKKKETIFRRNPFDSRLRTHKLHGKEREAWAF